MSEDTQTQANWVFQVPEPVLDVEVSILAAPGAHVDWVHGNRRDEAIRAIVDRCASVFETEINGRIEHVRHSTFNHHGMTVHLTIAASDSPQVEEVVKRQLGSLERTLEARLQSHFGWEQAAVSVQVETHPSYINRGAPRPIPNPSPIGGISVYQPPGGSNAIAPVIVHVPSTQTATENKITLPYQPVQKERSATVAGWLGALCAFAVAIVIATTVGPLASQINALNELLDRSTADQRVNQAVLRERNRQIARLERQNANLVATVNRMSARRGRASSRWDQPPTTLPDTGQVVVGAASTGSVYAEDTIGSGVASP